MRKIIYFSLAVVFVAIMFSLHVTGKSFAQTTDQIWTNASEQDIQLKGERRIIPLKYRIIKSGILQIKSTLSSAPFEFSDMARTSPLIIELPMPSGEYSKFIVTEYSMMEPGLAQQFPEMKTYTIKGIDDPYATGKLDVTLHGFHGMVLTPNGDYYIDPYSTNETDVYISYFKYDLAMDKSGFTCFTENTAPDFINNNIEVMTGQQLRTYRLACAGNGEYTTFHGGTVPAGQAAIVTAINRVNGIYERDMSVRMTLVANNTNIVFTNSATDPYTNGNGSTMLGQNQTTCDNASFIGSANYDIGHVFSTGGGGVAFLGIVCVGGNKAKGVTGLPSPTGDPFYIDFVAHEMGHQFGGNHTFNSVTGNCGGGNRNGSTAWEPGSGSTIMAYAGICGGDDLQPNSNDYFHSGSASEIISYTQSGSGNSCPVITATGNTPPTVSMPSGGFTIPISTPFALTGSATDVENPSSLSYCWEEFDVGPSGSPGSPSGNAPIFRSFSPVTNGTRTFPKLSDLLNNTSTIGEILPTYGRNLSFRMTVRDNNAGGGGINFGSVTFAVNASSGPFVVTSPNTNVNWNSGIPQTVTWNVANTTASPVSCANVIIKLSVDGGNTYPTTLLASTPNDGSQSVTLPAVNTTTARIKVESVGNIFFDISNTNFTISNTNLPAISHTPITDQLKSAWPVTVNASITSIFPIDSSWVIWYKNSPATTKEFMLINTSGSNYSAPFNSVNSDVAVGDMIFYRIFAQNNSAGHEKDSTALLSFKIIDGVLCEGFFSATFPPSGWSLIFTDTQYWTRNTVSSYGIGSGSAKFNFWVAPIATDQSILTKTFANTLAGDSLKFDNAYAPYTDGRTDSLEILTSTNSGSSFSTLVRLWGNNTNGNLNTRTQLGSVFTPSSAQWATKKYALPVGTNKIKFRARSGFGNNLFLDSICVVNTAAPVPATITLAPEGFYNTGTGKLNIKDTVRVYLRNTASPYTIVDSGKTVIDSVSLSGTLTFSNAATGTYYVVVGHRNALETWSKLGAAYTKGASFSYDFTTASSKAFGDNQVLKGTKYCFYSGDVNQDYSIDGSDVAAIDNDASNFELGYLVTDLTGDGVVDGTDLAIADNNAFNFVIRAAPAGALAAIVSSKLTYKDYLESIRLLETKSIVPKETYNNKVLQNTIEKERKTDLK